jgi:tRNA (cmo5U34)-methyltransferase
MNENKPANDQAWESRGFIDSWDERTEQERSIRDMQRQTVVFMLPHPREQAIRILDLGAGYGALAAAVLADRPKATAVCYDSSEEMIRLGRERMSPFAGRIEFVRAALDAPDWKERAGGPFDAIISARALHHLTHEQRRRLFREAYDLILPDGCLINADNFRHVSDPLRASYRRARLRWMGSDEPATQQRSGEKLSHGAHYNGSMEEELSWLKEAGFRDVDVFWKFTNYGVYGGFR